MQGTAEIVPGLELHWSLPSNRGSVDVDLRAVGISVWRTTLAPGAARARLSAEQHLFKEDLDFSVDLGKGEISMRGDVCVKTQEGWHCHTFPEKPLIAWSPTLGSVGGHVEAHPPHVNDPTLGSSASVVPFIMRIPVDNVQRAGTPVGNMVKKRIFSALPDFYFNVCFSVGPFVPFSPGAYGDPTSPWFNLFFGYYEIECPKPAWRRPFGYSAARTGAAIDFSEVMRLGKADWNYFSNWMYGVPLRTVQRHDALDPGAISMQLAPAEIAGRRWDVIDIDGFSAVSAYESDAPNAAKLRDNTPLTRVWRESYGEPRGRQGHPRSFPATTLHARNYMAFSEDDSAFRTRLFGGTVNKAFDAARNAAFLDEQLAACRKVIEEHYPSLGFSR